MPLPPHTPVVLLAAVAGSGVGLFVYVFRQTRGSTALAAFMIAASVWSLAEGLTLASPGLEAKLFWTKVVWTVSPVIPVAWLVTVLSYSGREDVLTRARLAALVVEPAVFVSLVWSNDIHSLVWERTTTVTVGGHTVFMETFGLAFWAHVAYSYLLVAAGALVLVRLNFRTSRHFRSQGTVLLFAVFLPLLANTLSIFHLVPPMFDLTSVGFVLTGVVVTGALLRGQLLTVTPAAREIGRETLLDEIDDQVLIVDDADRVVDVNPAAADLLSIDRHSVVGAPLSEVDSAVETAISELDAGQTDLELTTDAGVRYFDVRVSALRRGHGGRAGRLVSLRDVTERRQREERLDVLNRLLRHNLRNEMNIVQGNAKLLGELVDTSEGEIDRRLDRITTTVETVVERSDKVGRLSRLTEAGNVSTMNLGRICRELGRPLESATDSAEVLVDVPDGLCVDAGPSLRFAIEEVIENAIEHTTDPTVRVEARELDDGFVQLTVSDDGPGLPPQELDVIEAGRETSLEHGSGIGLWLVTWIVRAHGGRIELTNRESSTEAAAESAPDTGGEAVTGVDETEVTGATVTLELPGRRAETGDSAADSSDSVEVPTQSPGSR